MPDLSKPSAVLYNDLKSFGKIPHKRAVQIMLTPQTLLSMDPSRISRDVVNADPGSGIGYQYRNFKDIAEELVSEMSSTRGGGEKGRAAVLAHYGGSMAPAVQQMCRALSAYGIQPGPYITLIDRIALNRIASDRQKCVLAVMLFVACGALANPQEAARLVDGAFEELHATGIGTVVADTNPGTMGLSGAGSGITRIGLLPVVGGVATTPLYEIALPPETTTIGSKECSIMEVAPDVSRKHLAIWHDGRNWVCQGLGSLNGTTLISGASRSVSTVELPRNQKMGPSPVCVIAPGDTLCLGATTRFLVTSLQVG